VSEARITYQNDCKELPNRYPKCNTKTKQEREDNNEKTNVHNLFIVNYIWGVNQFNRLNDRKILFIILFQGIVGFALQYSVWYEAIKRINLSKATALVCIYPIFSIILAWFVLKETPVINQLIGLGIIILGIFGLSRIKSEHREKIILKN